MDAVADHPLPLIVIGMGTANHHVRGGQEHGNWSSAESSCRASKVSLDSPKLQDRLAAHISLEVPERTIENTIDRMRAGIIFGNVDMIDGIIDRMERELGQPATVVATGGFSPFHHPHVPPQDHLRRRPAARVVDSVPEECLKYSATGS